MGVWVTGGWTDECMDWWCSVWMDGCIGVQIGGCKGDIN